MATRLFLSRKQNPWGSDDPPAVTPSASWDSTSGYTRYGLSLTPQAESFNTRSVSATPNAAEYDVMALQFHSEPMTAQTIGAVTFHGVMRAYGTAGAGGLMMQCCVRVVGTDGTVRGTLLDLHTEASLSSTFGGAFANRQIPPPAVSGTMTGLAVLDGDRLIVEIGYRAIGSSGSSTTGYFDSGSNIPTLLLDNETDTAQYTPWIEFDQDLVFLETSVGTRVGTERISPADGLDADLPSYAYPTVGQADHLWTDVQTETAPTFLAHGMDNRGLPPAPSGSTPVTTHYRKRAWKSDPLPAEYVEWETTDPDGAYPGGGTLFPPLGVILSTWTT